MAMVDQTTCETALPLRPLLVQHSPSTVRAGYERILPEGDVPSAVAAQVVDDGADLLSCVGRAASGAAGRGDLIPFARHDEFPRYLCVFFEIKDCFEEALSYFDQPGRWVWCGRTSLSSAGWKN